MAYTNITIEQKNSLQYLLSLAKPPLQKDIALLFNKHRTSIFRQVKGNEKDGRYNSGLAKQNAKERRLQAHYKCRKIENNK
jgi:IS30 family transposase